MGNNHFFAMMARMKYINRWSLMRNSDSENISEHSLEVAMIANALAVISNVRFGNSLNPEKAALIGVYHDTTEIITGDMPTPVKYFNPSIKTAYKEVENIAADKLLTMLPEDMQEYYHGLFYKQEEDEYLWRLVKAADKLSALIKCIKEEKMGNREFANAHVTIKKALDDMELPEIAVFEDEFLHSFELTLDELQE